MKENEKGFIREIVIQTIAELKRNGILKNQDDMAYYEVTGRLKQYYEQGESDEKVRAAIKEISGDLYEKIIPLYFRYGYTIEDIAEVFNVETSTISRNKKRLCIKIYDYL